MTKAVSLSLGFICLLAAAVSLSAQTNPVDMAVNEAVLRQANTIVLRQKLQEAKNTVQRGDLPGAAKLYEDAYALVEQIGSGIDAERTQTISGLASTRLELARQAQDQGNLREAATQVDRVLKVDPQNPDALVFKRKNDRLLESMRGQMADEETTQQVPYIKKDRTDAGTLVQDGKLLYEMGKFDEAEVKLKQAMTLDPDNEGAFYYMNLVKQARYDRAAHQHTIDDQDRMVQVEAAYVKPVNRGTLPTPNPYTLTNLVHTGVGREAIYSKLNRIRLDNVAWSEGLPLNEVLHNLSEQAKLRDPDKKGINFLFNPNTPGAAPATTPGAAGTPGTPTTIDPTTGLPIPAAQPTSGGEALDPSSVNVKLTLSDVTLGQVLDAIVLVADHPIKYSVEDYGVVFSGRAPDAQQLETRTFKVDPNTFYQGLESVSSASFGAANLTSGGVGGAAGGGAAGGAGGVGTFGGAAVAVVNASPGAGSIRAISSAGGAGGGGGGGVGAGQGTSTEVNGLQSLGGNGGLRFVTSPEGMQDVSLAAQGFFKTLGVDLTTPGKSIFFNDRLGVLFVRATPSDLDTIERAIQVLNTMPTMVHIKARFIEVEEDDNTALGFDWYLGQTSLGNGVVGQGGNAGSLSVPTSAANPQGTFPGNSFNATSIASGVQSLTGGLENSAPAVATITGILTNPSFQMVIHALAQRHGTEQLAEPEVTTTSGRQTQMRATTIQTIITSFTFQPGGFGGTTTTTTGSTVP